MISLMNKTSPRMSNAGGSASLPSIRAVSRTGNVATVTLTNGDVLTVDIGIVSVSGRSLERYVADELRVAIAIDKFARATKRRAKYNERQRQGNSSCTRPTGRCKY